ncbi:septal ring lytic transglycosylase RlpA family protein [Rhizobiales bacterium]|uniref:septal ring lytic transglycosylase RlpA family protein n=1 Tax=Hongsoonwoonella zoysiae TaxID=2821844 RepID=UPI00155F74DF|nr:septal ring lytic transglycosylase RlpA family protein [Hongsoonwoonella zoysiae]NRG16692.1 septal ring lytic transglycosylase RlpA family protein [Hongsoonwoonella zoysiae]
MLNRTAVAGIIALGAMSFPFEAQAQCGKASWYQLTSRTASGVMANPEAMTAAHRSLPFGTQVKVENLSNGKSVVLKIVDRGPFVRGRVIDVSRRAARELGFLRKGVARVKVMDAESGKSINAC